MIWISISSGTE